MTCQMASAFLGCGWKFPRQTRPGQHTSPTSFLEMRRVMLRLLELYTSMQGECDRTGMPTQFVRFAGCNLRCPGWPCDTPFAIFPDQYRKEQQLISPDQLRDAIYEEATVTGATNICLTGGEPMLQKFEDLNSIVIQIAELGWPLEMFSNGTLLYPAIILELCSIRMDWKLPGSGEDPNDETRIANYYNMGTYGHHTIKFTIKDAA